MIRRIFFLLCVVFFFSGCGFGDLDLDISFEQVQGLKKDAPVLFEKNQIGSVTGIRYEESGSHTVHVKIRKEFKQAVTEHSRFSIVIDPSDRARMAVAMVRVAEGGKPLVDGARVAGSGKYSVLFEQTWKSIENGLDDFEEQVNKFSDQLKGIPESKAYKDFQKELEQLSEEMNKAGKEGREKLEKEILPQLQDELKKLKEKWFKLQKEQKAEKQLEV